MKDTDKVKEVLQQQRDKLEYVKNRNDNWVTQTKSYIRTAYLFNCEMNGGQNMPYAKEARRQPTIAESLRDKTNQLRIGCK